jgi:hypothetical protein
MNAADEPDGTAGKWRLIVTEESRCTSQRDGQFIAVDGRPEVAGSVFTKLIHYLAVSLTGLPHDALANEMDVAAERSKYESLITRFETAMRTYHGQNWREAAGMFGQLLASFPEDGPTQIFMQRALEFMETAPEPDWDAST